MWFLAAIILAIGASILTTVLTASDNETPTRVVSRHVQRKLARVRAVLRRARPGTPPADEAPKPAAREVIVVGPLEIDHAARVVKKDGSEVTLTSFEYRILLVLARRAGETVTREELASEVREPAQAKTKGHVYDPSVDRSLDVHVSRLRQKLEEDPKEPRLIKTVRGVGYVLSRPA